MDWAKHKVFFSGERINRYLKACNYNVDVAIKLYKFNIQASQALYPLLSVFEVSLRNAVDQSIAYFFNDKNWLITQRLQFVDHVQMVFKDSSGAVYTDQYFRNKLIKAENWLNKRNELITHGKLLAELTFGFWLKFFDKNSMKVLNGAPLNAFVNKPRISLWDIHQHIKSVHLLRNRIAHNEPICFNPSGVICLETLADYESKLVEALGWLGTDLVTWTEKLNFYKLVYNRISALYLSLPHASSSA